MMFSLKLKLELQAILKRLFPEWGEIFPSLKYMSLLFIYKIARNIDFFVKPI
jgi:hypothetical protein